MANSLRATLDTRSSLALQAKLLTLGPKLEKKVIGKATGKAITVIAKEARRYARKSKRSGHLAKNIGVKTKKYKGAVVSMAGPTNKKDPRTGENPANIAHLIEFPVKPHRIMSKRGLANTKDVALGFQGKEAFFGKSVEHPGFGGRPFLTPAFNAKHKEAQRIYGDTLAAEIRKEAVKEGITTF